MIGSGSIAVPRATPEREARWREERRLLERYRSTGDPVAREALVMRFLPMVRRLAARYGNTSEPFDDLVQVGSLGLLKAIEGFDPDRETAFATFAVPTIVGEIKRHFRDRTWSVKVPRGAKEAAQRVAGAERELEGSLGRSPTAAETAAALRVGVEEVLDARMAALAHSTESLDQPHGADADGRRGVDVYQVEEPGFRAAENAATLDRLLPCLDARQREVLRLRFQEDLGQKEIGELVGCSQMHVSRLIRGAIDRLAALNAAQAGLHAGDHGTSAAA